jgi:AraC family transcriptional regulator
MLSEGYMSSAIGASLTSNTSALIYKPQGTTHQNRFRGGRARLVAISGGDGSEDAALWIRDPHSVRLVHSVARELAWAPALTLEARALQLHPTVLPVLAPETPIRTYGIYEYRPLRMSSSAEVELRCPCVAP